MSIEDRARRLRDLVASSLSEDDLDMLDIEIDEGEWDTVVTMALSAAETASPPIIVPADLRETIAA